MVSTINQCIHFVKQQQQQQVQQQQQQQPEPPGSPPLPDDGWVVLSRT